MAAEKLKIGLVGLGAFSRIAHLPAYFSSPYREWVEVAAVCDRSPERLRAISEEYRIAGRYEDHAAMLEGSELDAVVVATPDHTHTPIVLDAIAAGKDVLVEKPLAMATSEARAIVRAADEAGVLVLVDFHKREDPCHAEARERILQGEYGSLQFGWAWMQDAISVPAGDFFHSDLAHRSSPNWFLGVHFYDLLRFLTGLEPVEVRAAGYRQVLASRGIPTYDAIKADFVLANGASVSVFTSWNLPDGVPALTRQGVYLQFSAGDVEIDSSRRGFTVTSHGGYRHVNPMFIRTTPRGRAGYGIETIGEALRLFHRAKHEGRDAVVRDAAAGGAATARDGLRATVMAEGVDRSLERGRTHEGVVLGEVVNVTTIPGTLE